MPLPLLLGAASAPSWLPALSAALAGTLGWAGSNWMRQANAPRRQMQRSLAGTRTAEVAQQQAGMSPWQMTSAQRRQYSTGLGRAGQLGNEAESASADSEAGTNVAGTRTEESNGWLYMVTSFADGTESWMPLGRAEGEGAGAPQWREGELELQRQQQAQAQAQFEREMEMQQQMMEYQQNLSQEQMAWEQERFGMEEERIKQQRLAQLSAQPMSWLQYAAESGENPAIQPWMLPLMQGQYSQLQAGGAIPGYEGTEGMTDMPELLRPSAQLSARMGPTAMQQYYGYRQAQEGIPPEEAMWRTMSMAPPGGGYSGLSRRR